MNTIKKSFLITLVTLSVFPSSVLAVTYKPTITVQTQTTSKTPTTIKPGNAMMVAKVEYLLPYPGILPDNPLYFLKAARDKIIEFLIADPVRKAEFYILQSDKRLGMTSMLLEKGNTTRAETT
ncbi:hypothetical protein HY086_00365, partial [Candidatus Gottesmanbacteria bacterium]|nr:hypothetical protein [Candidatus Gottesmanbacteria bacterium]